ncbi:MAG: hypothetical protein O9322_14690 [Beijerinckiaceae bacterium]|nr:hypothetical protein [Beijerinckiaceae bacterium]MCZ8300595.1 hypothetical protein [Beijerinckiaceae bacterium]
MSEVERLAAIESFHFQSFQDRLLQHRESLKAFLAARGCSLTASDQESQLIGSATNHALRYYRAIEALINTIECKPEPWLIAELAFDIGKLNEEPKIDIYEPLALKRVEHSARSKEGSLKGSSNRDKIDKSAVWNDWRTHPRGEKLEFIDAAIARKHGCSVSYVQKIRRKFVRTQE